GAGRGARGAGAGRPVGGAGRAAAARVGVLAGPPPAVPAVATATATPPVAPVAPAPSRTTAVILGGTALCLAGVGLILNANFAASLGQTGLAAALLAAIGLAVDVLAGALPTAASQPWHARG